MIRPVQQEDDLNHLVQIGERTGIFGPGESDSLLGDTLKSLFKGELPAGHQAHLLQSDDDIAVGWIYFGPMENESIWNLWWIGVDPMFKSMGYGKLLLKYFETTAKSNGAIRVIVETSSNPSFERTRQFYHLQGYFIMETIRDGYAPGEDKIVFGKLL